MNVTADLKGATSPTTAPGTVYGLGRQKLAGILTPFGARAFVPAQIFRWLYARHADSFAAMSDLPLALRTALGAELTLGLPEVAEIHPTADGTTRYVFRMHDGERTEAVWIPGEGNHTTLCLSSQVGCPLACTFCVSGVLGVKRNLTTGEMLAQARAMLAAHPVQDRVNVVFMGMGEALLNFDALLECLAILSDPEGFNIAMRRMTVSTAGHVPAIERFGALAKRPHLAISLNATTDEVRTRIMPINKAWPIDTLLNACRKVKLLRGERITFEYVLLAGINDTDDDARRLPKLLAHLPAKVNLIPWNETPGFAFTSPTPESVARFASQLEQRRVLVTVRRRRGAEAGAACGQLAVQRPTPSGPAGCQ